MAFVPWLPPATDSRHPLSVKLDRRSEEYPFLAMVSSAPLSFSFRASLTPAATPYEGHRTMDLDPATLGAVSILLSALMGGLLLFAWFQNRMISALGW